MQGNGLYCDCCGKEIDSEWIMLGLKVFCSRECLEKWRESRRRGEAAGRRSKRAVRTIRLRAKKVYYNNYPCEKIEVFGEGYLIEITMDINAENHAISLAAGKDAFSLTVVSGTGGLATREIVGKYRYIDYRLLPFEKQRSLSGEDEGVEPCST